MRHAAATAPPLLQAELCCISLKFSCPFLRVAYKGSSQVMTHMGLCNAAHRDIGAYCSAEQSVAASTRVLCVKDAGVQALPASTLA